MRELANGCYAISSHPSAFPSALKSLVCSVQYAVCRDHTVSKHLVPTVTMSVSHTRMFFFLPTGVYTAYKTFLHKDKALIKRLLKVRFRGGGGAWEPTSRLREQGLGSQSRVMTESWLTVLR